MDFALTINAHQMSLNKDNCRKADFYVFIGERSKYLVVGSRFLDCVAIFTCSLNSAELSEINPKFVTEGESATVKNLQQNQLLYS